MKTWIILIAFTIAPFFGLAGKFEVEVTHFTAVRAMGNFKVNLEKGDEDKVAVVNDDDDLSDSKIVCEVEKKVLVIRLKGDTYKERQLVINVTYTDLSMITSKMGCELTVLGEIIRDEVEFNAESGGKIKANVQCKKVKASISAGGSIHLEGTTDKGVYSVTAGGTIATVSLAADIVKASVTAGGEIICTVKSELAIKITSGGSVSYQGNPEAYEENITLGGKIVKMKQ